MKSFVIVVELRNPRNAEERRLAGCCTTEDRFVSRIFLNATQPAGEMADTFFHEIAHAYMHWRGHSSKGKRAETRAMTIGKAAEMVLKGVKNG